MLRIVSPVPSFDRRASHMHIGTIVMVYNHGTRRIHGLLQVISPAVTYVGKAVTNTTPCIYMESRWWYHFHSLSLRNIPFAIPEGESCFLSRKMTLSLMKCFFDKNGAVPYPVFNLSVFLLLLDNDQITTSGATSVFLLDLHRYQFEGV